MRNIIVVAVLQCVQQLQEVVPRSVLRESTRHRDKIKEILMQMLTNDVANLLFLTAPVFLVNTSLCFHDLHNIIVIQLLNCLNLGDNHLLSISI